MISIVIPSYNEEKTIRNTIAYIYKHSSTYKRLLKEVIVVDGGSTDNTVAEAEKTGATVMKSPRKGRAAQLNYGARQATGQILYFLKANALPPENFISDIAKAYTKGYAGGTFSLKFDYSHWFLRALSWCTNHSSWVYLSDQSLFVTKELFQKAGGFREDHLVLANLEMIKRIKRYTNFIVMKDLVVSSVKFTRYSMLRTQLTHATVYIMHKMGYPQRSLTKLYRKFLRWDIGPKPIKGMPRKEAASGSLQVKKELKVISQ
jgi:rSAM/selenodomain-associated transferase 2